MVTTKEDAPGGKRTEKVGLPYDPDLFDHMLAHGVHIEVRILTLELVSARCGQNLPGLGCWDQFQMNVNVNRTWSLASPVHRIKMPASFRIVQACSHSVRPVSM